MFRIFYRSWNLNCKFEKKKKLILNFFKGGIASFRGEGGLSQKGILGLRESDLV